MNNYFKLLSVWLLLSVLLCKGFESGAVSVVSSTQQVWSGTKQDARLKVHSAAISQKDNRKVTLDAKDVYSGIIRIKLTEVTAEKVSKKIGTSAIAQRRSATKGMNVGVAALNTSLDIVKASEMKRVFPYNARYEARQRAEGLHLWYEVKIAPELFSIAACEEMIKCADVDMAEPVLRLALKDNTAGGKHKIKGMKVESVNKEKQLMPFVQPQPFSSVMKRMFTSSTSMVPFAASARNYEKTPPTDDPYLLTQWHYYNFGQIEDQVLGKSKSGSDIGLFDAWKVTMGSPNVIVSIHDEGVEATHPDLADNMWVNEAELNGAPGVDDDGNGFVDDINGYNFWNFNGMAIKPGAHGTHVAGTVGAVNNNGIGVAGVAGGSGKRDGVKMISCQVLGSDRDATPNVGASYVYAANMGAVISQNSWGYSAPDYYEQSVLDGIDYFIKYAGKNENGQPLPNTLMVGGIVIVAAGNVGSNEAFYPQYYEPCMAVGATGAWFNRTNYTNWGNWVDISAPGGDHDKSTAYANVLSCAIGGAYGYMSGTSMACPHVSGVAALILSKFGGRAYTPDMLRQRLYNGATPWSEINSEYTGALGVGLLNAARSLTINTGVAPDSINDLQVKNCGFDFVKVIFTAPKDTDDTDAKSYEIHYSKEPLTAVNVGKSDMVFQLANKAGYREEVIVDRLEGSTVYYIAVRSMDIYGNMSKLSNVVMATTGTAPGLIYTPDSLSLHIVNAKANPIGETRLSIGNTKGGDLRYSMKYVMREMPGTIPYVFPYTFCKVNNLSTPFSGKIGETDTENFGTFIAASRFNVEGVEEFNLTHITAGVLADTWYKGRPAYMGKKPFTVKIIRGGSTPSQGKEEFAGDYIVPGKAWLMAWGQDLTFDLDDNVLFKKGEHFWVVFDFPSGYLYPMLINDRTTCPVNYDVWSVDGEVWDDINNIQIPGLEPNFGYRIQTHSMLQNLPLEIITFDPIAGTVAEGTNVAVKVKVDASKIRDGHYSSLLVLTSNDNENAVTKIPFTFDVDGHLTGIRTPKRLDVGGTVQGFTNSVDIFVHSDALGIVKIDTIFADAGKDKFFSVKPNRDLKIEQGDSIKLTVSFRAPNASADGSSVADSIGLFISKLNFSHKGDVFHFMPVEANAIERPIATMDRTRDTIELKMGESKTVTFTLKNEGKYRLDYSIGNDETTDYDYRQARPWEKSYFGKTELGKEFEYISWSGEGEEDITADIKKGLHAYALPFAFNYYGKSFDSITIASTGCIAFGKYEDFLPYAITLGAAQHSTPATLVPIYFSRTLPMILNNGRGGEVWMKKQDDKVIIEFVNAGYSGHFGSIDVQTVIYADGRIDFCYKNFRKEPKAGTWNDVQLPLSSQIGLTNLDGMSGMVIWHSRDFGQKGKEGWLHSTTGELEGFFEGTVYTYPDGVRMDTLWEDSFIQRPFIKYKRPRWGEDPNADNYNLHIPDADGRTIRKGHDSESVIIHITPEMQKAKNITPTSGSLFPGESQEVTMTFQIDKNLREEMLLARIPIATNDPLNKEMSFSVYLDYKSESLPVLSTLAIDFGKLGKDVSKEELVLMENKGGKLFKATAKMQKGEVFSVDNVSERICNGLSILNYNITFTPKDEKVYEDVLVIETDIQGQAPLTVNVKGSGIKRPVQEVVAEKPMTFEIVLGTPKLTVDTSFLLKNTGDSVLLYNMKANYNWIKYIDGNSPVSMYGNGYFWQNQQRLEPGREVVIKFRVDATTVPDNRVPYSGKLVIETNDPKNPKDSAQFVLTVFGQTGAQIKVGGKDTRVVNMGEALRNYYPIGHRAYGEAGEMVYDLPENDVYSDTISVTNTGSRKVILKRVDGYTGIPAEPQVAKLSIVDMSKREVPGFLMVDAGKTQHYRLKLSPSSDAYYAAKTGHYTVKYALTDVCDKQYGEKCKDLFGYTDFYEVTDMVWNEDWTEQYPVVRKEYYKSDTLLVSFDLGDVPNEGVTSDKKIHEYTLASHANSANNFNVTITNEPLADTLWIDMHKTKETYNKITKQVDLAYKMNVEELMREEYEALLVPKTKMANASTNAYTQKLLAGPMKRSAFVAQGTGVNLLTRATSEAFADSLNYPDYITMYDGFFPNKADEKLAAGIRYKAGEDGFNLTHFSCWVGMMINDARQGYDLEVKVLLGKDAWTAEAIYSETMHPEVVERTFTYNMFSFKEPVYIYPGQYFWIVVKSRVNTALASVLYMDGLFNSLDYKNNFWFDNEYSSWYMSEIMGGSIGWFISAYSAEKRDVPENWIQLSRNSGTIAMGTSDVVNVVVNASKDVNKKSGRYAKISVNSNDCYPFETDATMRSGIPFRNMEYGNNTKVKLDNFVRDRGYVLVKMEVNRAPEFVMNRDRFFVSEMQDSVFSVRLFDYDGDKVSLTVQLDSAVLADSNYGIAPELKFSEGVETDSTVNYSLFVKTGYESEGIYYYSLKASDGKNPETTYPIWVGVSNVNRAPILVGNTTFVIAKEQTEMINLNTLFRELDREPLQFIAESGDIDLFAITVVDSMLSIYGWEKGTSKVRLVAIDPQNASVNATLDITVIQEDPTLKSKEVNVYPNPVVDIVNCDFSLTQRSEVEIRIFATDGRMFYRSDKIGYLEGKHHTTINVNQLPGGIYILQYLVNGKAEDTQKFVK